MIEDDKPASRPRPVETTEGAMDKYLARQEAERAKTTKLRAQRLAAEAKSISSLSRSTNRPARRSDASNAPGRYDPLATCYRLVSSIWQCV
jgi:hypothetical protein